MPFQRRNARSIVRAVKILSAIFESLGDASTARTQQQQHLPAAANTCFRELYILLYRSKILLDYCAHSSRLWLLLQNSHISGHFHDLTQEISTLLDQIELLHRQARRSKLYLDPRDEALRLKVSSFLDDFDKDQPPDISDLRETFVEKLGIQDARSCCAEIEFLEERIYSQEDDVDPAAIYGVIALTRYARFSLFEFEEAAPPEAGKGSAAAHLRKSSSVISQIVPKDFCCPISLDLMRDPVIVSTGQTYDRSSIVRWIEEGHRTCPNSGQTLSHTRLVPNRSLRNLIAQWCAANGVPCDPPATLDGSAESFLSRAVTRAAVQANRATARLLIVQLSRGSEYAKTESACELRILTRTGKENRLCVVNAVTAILNLSLPDRNKYRIMEEPGCLRSIVEVFREGWTTEARENAAAVLFSLSVVHEYKLLIASEEGALEALAALLAGGTQTGKKDAVATLFNLSTHPETSLRMVESKAVAALVAALATEAVAEEAAGALALLARQPAGARASPGRTGHWPAWWVSCGGEPAGERERRRRSPGDGAGSRGLIQTLLFTGTKRARRKAASLARVCRRTVPSPLSGGWAFAPTMASQRTATISTVTATAAAITDFSIVDSATAVSGPMAVPAL
ncbi:unnamed protein product [Spirodela intermedia]|uniref:RING-type E3 ubiquitin transferase n=1 Tax=Spirodela intermedia TaxID=51605 RepID=A0A7I8JMU2_SPIIN|nr:unnamed protein product [Spirodela intermedia]CAA6671487.1 unnamed protein product [Spirodela intermedia]